MWPPPIPDNMKLPFVPANEWGRCPSLDIFHWILFPKDKCGKMMRLVASSHLKLFGHFMLRACDWRECIYQDSDGVEHEVMSLKMEFNRISQGDLPRPKRFEGEYFEMRAVYSDVSRADRIEWQQLWAQSYVDYHPTEVHNLGPVKDKQKDNHENESSGSGNRRSWRGPEYGPSGSQ